MKKSNIEPKALRRKHIKTMFIGTGSVWLAPLISIKTLPSHAQTSPINPPPVDPPPMEDNNSMCQPIGDPGSDPSSGTGASNGFTLTSMGTNGNQAYMRIINDEAVNDKCFNIEIRIVSGANSGQSTMIYVCPANFANRFTDPNVVIVALPFSGNSSDVYAIFNDQGMELDRKAVGTAVYGGADGPIECV